MSLILAIASAWLGLSLLAMGLAVAAGRGDRRVAPPAPRPVEEPVEPRFSRDSAPSRALIP
jgi:hypothetical protein